MIKNKGTFILPFPKFKLVKNMKKIALVLGSTGQGGSFLVKHLK